MKVFLTLGLMLSFFSGINGQSAEKIKQQVLDSVRVCCSNALEIINSEEAKTVKHYMDASGTSSLKEDFIGKMGTTVHECLHSYDNVLGEKVNWDANTYPIAYFIDKGVVVSFAGKRIFKTDKLHASFFPKEVKKLFRYGTYVYDNSPSTASSNQWGIYGLLEEFNAYYHDMQSQIEYFECHEASFDEYFRFSNEMNAYYEFNIFMAYYLKYAQKYEKATYEYMQNNKELRTAYTLIETNWRILLTKVFSNRDLASVVPELKSDRLLFTADLEKIMQDFMLSSSELSSYKSVLTKGPIDMGLVEKNLEWAEGMNALVLEDYGINYDELNDIIDASNEELDLEFQLKESGYHYVTVLVTDDINHLMMTYLAKVMKQYPNSGVYDEEMNAMKMHLFVNKFKDINQAKSLAAKIKTDFPEVKVE
jgi:hypothetical protein